MKKFMDLIPILVAIISATAILTGYIVQKNLEKEAEMRKTRQEIYSQLVASITQRNEIQGRIEAMPEWQKAQNNSEKRSNLYLKNAELSKNWHDRTGIAASLCLYGTDDAIKAYAVYTKQDFDPRGRGGNFGELVLALRRSIYHGTKISADEANLVIWGVETTSQASSRAR